MNTSDCPTVAEFVELGRKIIAGQSADPCADEGQWRGDTGYAVLNVTPPEPAPGPYDWMSVTARNGSSDGHIYLIDANGRKIGCVWGKTGEKIETAKLLARAWELRESGNE